MSMFQDCECCGTGIAIGYRVEKGTAYYRPDGRIVLPWELREMSEAEKATLRAEERIARIPVAYMDEPCPHCAEGKHELIVEAYQSKAKRTAEEEINYYGV